MKRHADGTRRHRTRGQALAEMGIVVVLLMMMVLGIIEFGRMLMLTNMVVHAARDGARIAAVTPGNDFSAAEQHVTDLLATAGLTNLNVAATTAGGGGGGGIGTVTVTVTGNIPYIFPGGFWGDGIDIARSVTFRDEA